MSEVVIYKWAEDRQAHPDVRHSDPELERFFLALTQEDDTRVLEEQSTWEIQWYPCPLTERHERLMEFAAEQARQMLDGSELKITVTVPPSVAVIVNQQMQITKWSLNDSIAAAA